MTQAWKAREFRFVREFDGELVILDDQHDVAHRLSAEAVAVWRACDGNRGTVGLAARTGLQPARVHELVQELGSRGLLTAPAGETRRTVLRRAMLTGAAVAAAPAITSVLVPTPAEAFTSQPSAQDRPSGSDASAGGPEWSAQSRGAEPPTGGSGATQGASASGGRRGGQPSRRPAGTDARGGAAGAGDASAGAPGGREAAGAVTAETLPFTGSDIAKRAAVGAGLLGAGVAARAAGRRVPEP